MKNLEQSLLETIASWMDSSYNKDDLTEVGFLDTDEDLHIKMKDAAMTIFKEHLNL